MNATDTFNLPDLGEGLTEAEIVTWHVSVGDRVVTGQPLVSVETDKAVVEIPAPQSGVIGALHAEVGDRLPVGAPLVTFGAAGTVSVGVVGRLEEAAPSTPPAAGPVQPSARTEPAEPTQPPAAAGASVAPEPGAAPGAAALASPAVRQLARELGVDLAALAGSGPGGVIVSGDVRDAAAQTGTPGTPIRGARRAMAERMAAAHARVVPASVTGEADIEAWTPGTRPLSRLVRAIAAAVRAEPRLNAAFDDTRWELRANPALHLGIAMETDDGLFVPVLRDVDGRAVADLAADIEALRADVVARTVAPERLRGQTLTLSNFGAVAGIHATMVVVPPQVAIVGAGRATPRVVPGASGPVVHRMLPLSITIDHRVITGVEACRFLAALITDLELSQ